MEQFPHEGLTFDDVSLVTQYAEFLPDEADIIKIDPSQKDIEKDQFL